MSKTSRPSHEIDDHIATFSDEERQEYTAAETALDLVSILYRVRQERGPTQREAAKRAALQQQASGRLEKAASNVQQGKLLQQDSHLAHVEEPELYVQAVLDFLQRVESIEQLIWGSHGSRHEFVLRQSLGQLYQRPYHTLWWWSERIKNAAGTINPTCLHTGSLSSDHIERIGGDQSNLLDRPTQAVRHVPVHLWGWFIDTHLVHTHESLAVPVETCRVHDRSKHGRAAVGKDDHRESCIFEQLQARFDISKALEVVVLGHEGGLLMRIDLPSGCGQRVVKRFTGHLLEVLVALHGGEAKGELQLFLSPELRNALCIIGKIALKLLPDANGIDQRAVHIEGERL